MTVSRETVGLPNDLAEGVARAKATAATLLERFPPLKPIENPVEASLVFGIKDLCHRVDVDGQALLNALQRVAELEPALAKMVRDVDTLAVALDARSVEPAVAVRGETSQAAGCPHQPPSSPRPKLARGERAWSLSLKGQGVVDTVWAIACQTHDVPLYGVEVVTGDHAGSIHNLCAADLVPIAPGTFVALVQADGSVPVASISGFPGLSLLIGVDVACWPVLDKRSTTMLKAEMVFHGEGPAFLRPAVGYGFGAPGGAVVIMPSGPVTSLLLPTP